MLGPLISPTYVQLLGRSFPALYATILLSALVHEYVIAVSLGFASPILILEYAGLGGMLHSPWPAAKHCY